MTLILTTGFPISQYYPPQKKTFWEKLFRLSRGDPNYEVSPVKTFLQLWSDYGLRDYGIDYFHRGRFPREHKRECIKMWVSILYPIEIDVDEIENELLREIQVMVKKFYEKNPVHTQNSCTNPPGTRNPARTCRSVRAGSYQEQQKPA